MAKPVPVPIEFRTIDGSGNNLADPGMNAAGAAMERSTPAHFADGISVPLDGFPNPRDISNIVVQGESPDNPQGLSGFMYAIGQEIDHDLDLMKGEVRTSASMVRTALPFRLRVRRMRLARDREPGIRPRPLTTSRAGLMRPLSMGQMQRPLITCGPTTEPVTLPRARAITCPLRMGCF
jgi:hypothetical protein